MMNSLYVTMRRRLFNGDPKTMEAPNTPNTNKITRYLSTESTDTDTDSFSFFFSVLVFNLLTNKN
ncbi:hypothetical protein PGB90_006254 [Kerria lacca]